MKDIKSVKLSINDEAVEIPLLLDSAGNKFIDIRNLHKQVGMFTYDPGLVNTAICDSAITYINGEKGELLHRGYSIENLTANNTYLEVAFLLLHGYLPPAEELEGFTSQIYEHASIPENILWVVKSAKKKSHPMPILASLLMSYCTYHADTGDVYDKDYRSNVAKQVLGVFLTICSISCQNIMHTTVELIKPKPELSYASNFLNMCFKDESKARNEAVERAMNFILTIHADHEQNASSSSVRFTGSSLTNPFAALSAGISSLWGKSHGGASIAAGQMIESIRQNSLSIEECLKKAKDKSDPFRLMGFGHRIYKTYDPRAQIGLTICKEMLENTEFKTKELLDYFEVAQELEAAALTDQYFKDRNLYPNVDFYVAVLLRIIGFPIDAFTLLFALARSVGWIAQWSEMYEMANGKSVTLVRPRQIYKGKL